MMSPAPDFVTVLFAGVVPRDGSDAATAEDKFAVTMGAESFRAAVADGASDGVFADLWADLLTQAWAASDSLALAPLEPLRRAWRMRASEAPLPWHLAARAAQGAGATFLGVRLAVNETWEAIAAGDSVLIQLRDGVIVAAFPVTRSEDFPEIPLLLHTDPARSAEGGAQIIAGRWRIGDEMLLMTDALAAWFLREAAAEKEPHIWFAHLASSEAFADRIRQLRNSGRLRDDDVTLIHLRFTSTAEKPG